MQKCIQSHIENSNDNKTGEKTENAQIAVSSIHLNFMHSSLRRVSRFLKKKKNEFEQ